MRKASRARAPGRRGEADTRARPARPTHLSRNSREAVGLDAALASAIQYVVSHPRTAHEVRQKLARSGVDDAVIEPILAQLHERGLLDDAAYTKAYLHSRLINRGYGPQRLSRELHRRGIGRTLIADAVQHDLDADDVLAAAQVQATKRWARLTREDDPVRRRQKVYEFLRRRGFASAIVQQVLTELAEDCTPE